LSSSLCPLHFVENIPNDPHSIKQATNEEDKVQKTKCEGQSEMIIGTRIATEGFMNGKALQTIAVIADPQDEPRNRSSTARLPQRFVRPVWAGPAGFGDNNCVDTEARLYLSETSSKADGLACSFEEHSFPVILTFGPDAE